MDLDAAQLKLLFEQKLKPKLAPLESIRLATLKKKKALTVSVGAFFIAVLSGINSTPLLLLLFAILVYCIFAFKVSWDNYRGSYKQQIMATLLGEINKSLVWHKDKFITQTEFEQSGLSPKKIDSYSGEDLICGELEGFKVAMSELFVEQITPRPEGGSLRTPIFTGLFFKAQNCTSFAHFSYILPAENAKQGIKERLFAPFQSPRIGEKVALPESEFSQYFTVISSAPASVLQMLTPALINKLVDYRKQKQGIAISLSFVEQNVYIAIPEGRDLFEPKLALTVTDFEVIKGLFQDLVFFTGLLQELGLNSNTRH
ncbi:DUF3137 domain-containing protein [Thalassotalea euphylliae]|nr:DUF3137 domain-containing protein [Thalassotalea euphylliae]